METHSHATAPSAHVNHYAEADSEAIARPLPSRIMLSKIFPLNSKRLTSQDVMSIAEAMGLPTRGSVEETRLIIEGGLTDQGHEPRNVQVEVVAEEGGGTTINLHDSQGPLVKAHIRGGANVGE